MALQTYGIPPNTYNVGAGGVLAHRVVRQVAGEYRQVQNAAIADGPAALVGVAATTRDEGDSVAVREIAEAWVEVTGPVAIGQQVVIGDDTGRGMAYTGAAGTGTTRIGIARSAAAAAGELVEVDLRLFGTAAA